MHRHTRAYSRHQRTRWIARRRRQFARWVHPYDGRRPGGPRPLEVLEREFWDPRQLAVLAKWNGTCTCRTCRWNKSERTYCRAAETAAVRRQVTAALEVV